VPLERRSANAFFFDGVDTAGNTETITLTAQPIVPGTQDIYYLRHRHNQPERDPVSQQSKVNVCPPVINFLSDTFWLFSSNKHAVYEISKSWNQVFKDNYKSLYDKLLRDGQVRTDPAQE
jgi:hypothetical protein